MKPWRIVIVALLLCYGLFTPAVSRAERDSPVRIGVLTPSWGPTPSTVGLRDGLVELGYREDIDFVIGVRFTQGDVTALPSAARELIEYGVDIIFSSEDQSLIAVAGETDKIPVVFTAVSDPVSLGLVHSFARPGGNITGVADMAGNLGAKRLQTFREIIPRLHRVLIPYDAADTVAMAEVNVYRDAARRLGIELVEKPIRTAEEVQTLLAQIHMEKIDGIVPPPCCALNIPGFIIETASRQGIPTMFEGAFWAERGALASYGASFYSSGKQAARLVDKIIKGVKPAEIPVEVNSKVEFVINLKTAKTLGVTIPPEVLYQADKLIR